MKVSEDLKWTDVLFALKEDMERVSGMKYKTSERTFGLNNRSFIKLTDDATGSKMALVVLPGYTDSNEVYIKYETGEADERYRVESIGAINGMNNITARLPDTAEEIFEIMKNLNTR